MATVSAKNYQNEFAFDPISINEVHAQQTKVIIVPLADPADVNPTTYTVTVGTAGALDDEVLEVSVGSGEEVHVYEGQILKFGSSTVIVGAAATITDTPADIVVQPLPGAVTGTATTWGGYLLQAVDDVPLGLKSDSEDRGDLTYGLQKSMVTTSVSAEQQLSLFCNTVDEGLWKHVLLSVQSGRRIFVYMDANADGLSMYGPVICQNFDVTGAKFSLRKVSTTFNFQAPFAFVAPSIGLSTTQKTDANQVRSFVGLPPIV